MKTLGLRATLIALVLLACSNELQAQTTRDAAPLASTVRRAVLIGIDDYLANPEISDLTGASNDVDLMRSVLIGKFDFAPENIVVLKDSAATRENIIATIRDHLGQSKHGDVALVHYSGHGSQMIDRDGDEYDRMDETIVPHDSRRGDVFDISDDQINALMSGISAKTPNVVFILDSCHSGTAARAALAQGLVRSPRYAVPDERTPPSTAAGTRSAIVGHSLDDFRLPGSGYVLISGSRANELSNETRFGDDTYGAMTYYLASALQSAGNQATYRDVMEQTQADVSSKFSDQHPQIEGTGIDTAVFGIEKLVPQPYVLIDPVGDGFGQATIGTGRVFGLDSNTEMDVYPPGTKVFDGSVSPSARVRVKSVDVFTATANVTSGQVVTGSRSVLNEIRSPDFQLHVFLDDLPGQFAQELEAKLAEYDSIALTDKESDADLMVRAIGRGDSATALVLDTSLKSLARVPLGSPQPVQQVNDTIAHWGRWHAVLAMRNPSPDLHFSLMVNRVDGETNTPVAEQVPHGAKVEIRLTNNSAQDVYPILLDLTDKGRIGVIYPPASLPDALPPGQSITRRFDAAVPDGSPSVTDYVKAIVTTQQISADVFKLNPLTRKAAPAPGEDQSPLERYLAQYATGLTRDLAPVAVTGWATAQHVLRVARSGVDVDGFAAIFADADAASQSTAKLALSGSRSMCGSPSAQGCYEVVDFIDDPSMRLILPPAVRSGQRQLDSIGQAFDEAYTIRDEVGARRVEPLLEVELPRSQSAPIVGDPGTRGFGGSDPLPRAKNDDTWSLKYVRAPEAWALLRVDGKPKGSEAEGVVIAHPDTGYLEHAEIWGAPAQRPLWPENGYDYHDKDHSPLDERVDDNWLATPVHGTGSSSAIISAAGCQLAGVTKCPTGIAQGARLVPLRISTSVVNFNTKKLARALSDASGDDRDRVKVETDLASIAMGGPPSWSLWKAVRKAEDRGYIVVAAAGNYVRTVVWPARFDSVVSVAAVNAECKPWVHSSRGRGVDIAAPGESVWRATMTGVDYDEQVTGMGTGTTYGTATTSGVIALWIAKHKGTPAYEQLAQDGKLTQTLISLLAQTSWRPGEHMQPDEADCAPGVGWDDSRFGAGIVDAKALLEAPLVTSSTRGERVADVSQLPLWWSLYPMNATVARAQADYQLLFPGGASDDLEKLAIYESEIMYHYASDERLAEAIDRLIRGDRGEFNLGRIRERVRVLDTSSRLRNQLR